MQTQATRYERYKTVSINSVILFAIFKFTIENFKMF